MSRAGGGLTSGMGGGGGIYALLGMYQEILLHLSQSLEVGTPFFVLALRYSLLRVFFGGLRNLRSLLEIRVICHDSNKLPLISLVYTARI